MSSVSVIRTRGISITSLLSTGSCELCARHLDSSLILPANIHMQRHKTETQDKYVFTRFDLICFDLHFSDFDFATMK